MVSGLQTKTNHDQPLLLTAVEDVNETNPGICSINCNRLIVSPKPVHKRLDSRARVKEIILTVLVCLLFNTIACAVGDAAVLVKEWC